jgi:dTDP-4-dehydrorhamnose 3,5-epimerase
MKTQATPLEGLLLIERTPLADERGFLERLFCATELGLAKPIRQINRTLTKRRGTVRGMHFQHPPHAEIKIVTCTRGRVFDVAVDLRRGSPTFLRWHGVELAGGGTRSLLIPEGFAHGLQTLEDDCEMLYLHTADYRAQAEGGINPADARIGIRWPQPIAEMSARDRGLPPLAADFTGLAA